MWPLRISDNVLGNVSYPLVGGLKPDAAGCHIDNRINPACLSQISTPCPGLTPSLHSATVHWEIREDMKKADAELMLRLDREEHPHARPQIISVNDPQFAANDFKEFLRLANDPCLDQSALFPEQRKLERYHQILKELAILPMPPDSKLCDPDRATQAALRACQLSEWKQWAFIDTLAQAYAETGDFDRAAHYEKEALSRSGFTSVEKAEMEERPKLYAQKSANC